jgi:hypothetical protein
MTIEFTKFQAVLCALRELSAAGSKSVLLSSFRLMGPPVFQEMDRLRRVAGGSASIMRSRRRPDGSRAMDSSNSQSAFSLMTRSDHVGKFFVGEIEDF